MAHNLNIETGRYQNIVRNERKCLLCNNDDLEDEFHFILRCPLYADLRVKFIKPYFIRNPSVFKLIKLLTSNNKKEITSLGKYLVYAKKRRDESMRN